MCIESRKFLASLEKKSADEFQSNFKVRKDITGLYGGSVNLTCLVSC